MPATSIPYVYATGQLEELGSYARLFHPTARRHLERAAMMIIGVRSGLMPDLDVDDFRRELELVKEMINDDRARIPTANLLIGHCEAAIQAISAEGG